MKIEANSQVFTLKDREPLAKTILNLLHASGRSPGQSPPAVFGKNDFARLWEQLNDGYRGMLYEISKRPVAGINQKELQDLLKIEWEKMRGLSNGIARICARLEIEKPFRTEGYNEFTRVYRMDKDTAATVQKRMADKKSRSR
jgi:hypothetical protein